jgi:glycine betaine/proline transport system ATP-binding protein
MSAHTAAPAADGGPAVAARRLSKVYGLSARRAGELLTADDPGRAVRDAGGVLGAHDVSFEVRRGEVFVIMGLSGSGKSTLIRMVNRLNEPTAGEVFVDGEDILNVPERRLRSLRNEKMGMIFQHFSLFPHRSVRENAAYGLKVRGIGRGERLARADEALDRVGLGDCGHMRPDQLSGGMKQRVGLARALAVNPPVLLMDEPFSALDPLTRRDMQDLLLKLQAEDGRTTVFVTHDLNEAMRLGNQVMVMRDGRSVQVGQGIDILSAPADDYVTQFVADVDRARALTAADLMAPGHTLSVRQRPEVALNALSNGEHNSRVYVVDEDDRLLGVASERGLTSAVELGATDLRDAVTADYDVVPGDTVLADFVHVASRRTVPVAVVDEQRRLRGVISRTAILSALSSLAEERHA